MLRGCLLYDYQVYFVCIFFLCCIILLTDAKCKTRKSVTVGEVGAERACFSPSLMLFPPHSITFSIKGPGLIFWPKAQDTPCPIFHAGLHTLEGRRRMGRELQGVYAFGIFLDVHGVEALLKATFGPGCGTGWLRRYVGR